MNRDEIEKLLDGTTPGPWLWRWKSGSIHRPSEPPYTYGDAVLYPNDCGVDVSEHDAELIIAAPDIARTALDALARLEDAEAAQALLVERAVEAVEEAFPGKLYVSNANKAVARIRALAPASGVTALAALRAQRDAAQALLAAAEQARIDNLNRLDAERDDALTRLAAAEAQVGARDVTDDQLRRWIVAMSDWDAGGEDALYEMQDILDQRAALAPAAEAAPTGEGA